MGDTRRIWDLVVVGAGPSGATCAWKAAEAGLSVLILERAQSLPRYKPCGGGIPASVAAHVEGLEPERFADLSVTHLRHTYKGKQAVLAPMTTRSGEPAEIWMVQRPRFDNYLVEKARAAGATLQTGARARQILLSANTGANTNRLDLHDGSTIYARRIVGADGAKGVVGTQAGLRLQKRWGIAREMEIPFSSPDGSHWHPDLTPETVYLDYGSVNKGYAWIFPKLGCLSVGAGQLVPEKPSDRAQAQIGDALKAAMQTILASVGLSLPDADADDAPTLHAHPIPYWTGREPLATDDGAVLLVGDAAGLVQPLFGEGIQYALRSGALAAQCLVENDSPNYTTRVADLFAREFDAADRVGRVFHRTPYLSYRLGVKNPRGTALVGRLMAGEAHLADLEERLYDKLRGAVAAPLRRPTMSRRKD